MRAAALMLAAVLGPGGCGSPPERADAGPRAGRLAALNERAGEALARDELPRAARHYREALRLAESIEDTRAAGRHALDLAAVYQALERGDLARAAVEPLLVEPARFDREVVAEAAGRAALIALEAGDLDAAGNWLELALRECARPRCTAGVALANLRGRLLLEQGAIESARAALAAARSAARAANEPEEEANALRADARAAARMGEHGRAAALLGEALAIDTRLALPAKIALDLQGLAEVELARGDRAAARAYASRALAVSRASGRKGQQEAARRFLEAHP
ncbi:MAG: hypothetical protein IT529_02645 [Burkholderiales bacterium]|nr:hypothetical protein [Burkholderiales bacterium]